MGGALLPRAGYTLQLLLLLLLQAAHHFQSRWLQARRRLSPLLRGLGQPRKVQVLPILVLPFPLGLLLCLLMPQMPRLRLLLLLQLLLQLMLPQAARRLLGKLLGPPFLMDKLDTKCCLLFVLQVQLCLL